jgi:hypothetical protein
MIDYVLQNTLSSYYTDHLEERKSFFRKISNEKIMKWSNKELSIPLTKINNHEYRSVAVQMFRSFYYLLRFTQLYDG